MTFNMASLTAWFYTTEQEVLKVVTAIKQDAEVAQSEINSALHWIASNAPTISAQIIQVVNLVEAFGVVGNPTVAAAVEAANLAVAGLNAFAAASTGGKSNTQSVIDGYSAVKKAQASIASATAHAVAAPSA